MNTDLAFAQILLDASAAPFPLHAADHADQLASDDLLGLETSGLSVQFFANDAATGDTIAAPDIAPYLDYGSAVVGSANPALAGIEC